MFLPEHTFAHEIDSYVLQSMANGLTDMCSKNGIVWIGKPTSGQFQTSFRGGR